METQRLVVTVARGCIASSASPHSKPPAVSAPPHSTRRSASALPHSSVPGLGARRSGEGAMTPTAAALGTSRRSLVRPSRPCRGSWWWTRGGARAVGTTETLWSGRRRRCSGSRTRSPWPWPWDAGRGGRGCRTHPVVLKVKLLGVTFTPTTGPVALRAALADAKLRAFPGAARPVLQRLRAAALL